jgi:hypothetical protein
LFTVLPNGTKLYSNVVDVCNVKTGKWEPTRWLSEGRILSAATSLGKLVIFAGGCTLTPDFIDAPASAVDIFDVDTGLWTVAALSSKRCSLAAATVGNLALFGGGLSPG